MKNIISVQIQKDEYFTTFADGVFVSKEVFDSDSVSINLDGNYCIMLFYTLGSSRNVFLCSTQEKIKKINEQFFVNVSEPLGIMNILTGRAYDRFKRSLDYVKKATQGKVLYFPEQFFLEFSVMCENGHNNSECIERLVKLYNPNCVFEKKAFKG